MQKIITTDKATLLAVKLPEDASGPYIHRNRIFFALTPTTYDTIKLSGVNWCWQPLGFLKDITEEQAKEVVDEFVEGFYLDYDDSDLAVHYTTLESFNSLMKANGVYQVNPYKDVEDGWFNDIRYQQAEDNVGNWYILKQMN